MITKPSHSNTDLPIPSVCPRDCYDTCAILMETDGDGRVVSVRGDPVNPYTAGFVCPRGKGDPKNFVQNRVDQPHIRKSGVLTPVSWDECMDRLAGEIRKTLEETGPESILYLDFAGNTGLLANTFPKRLWNMIGVTGTDGALCSRSGHAGLALHYGDSYGVMPETFPDRDLMVFWGFNAAVSAPHMFALAKKAARKNGLPIVVIDPRRSESAVQADIHIKPRPGTDTALAYGIMHVLAAKDRVDHDFIREWTTGYSELQSEISRWDIPRVAGITGIPEIDIIQLADLFRISKNSAIMIGIGLQKSVHGAEPVRAVSLIPALLGLHRGFYYSNSHAYSKNSRLISGEDRVPGPLPVVSQVGLPKILAEGRFRMMFVTEMNPAVTLPDQNSFREGFQRDDLFTVVQDTHWSETAGMADMVLPAAAYPEKEDLVLPWSHRYIRYSPQVTPPYGDSRTEIDVMRELAKRLGRTEPWLYEDPWISVSAGLKDALEDSSPETLKSGRLLPLKLRPMNAYQTPSGRIELASSRAVDAGFAPVPHQSDRTVDPQRFLFLTSSSSKYTNSQFETVYGPIPPEITMHPDDAARLGIETGDAAVLSNDHGTVHVTVRVDSGIQSGVIHGTRLFRGLNERSQNDLMRCDVQDLGGGPVFNSVAVEIRRVCRD